jgi:tRNA nucleotidyltransferase (CCA-adding enzyme)
MDITLLFVRFISMLGKLIRLSITEQVGTPLGDTGRVYKLNHGQPIGKFKPYSLISGVLVMGIDNPVKHFDGRIIASVRFLDTGDVKLIAAPKSKRFIDCEIRNAISFLTEGRKFNLECRYERSCGAVIYRNINGQIRYLLIKNNRSSNWGFPKGHMEDGETAEETAKREVLEETGIHIDIIPDFVSKSEYTIQNRIHKTVYVYVAKTDDTQTIIQREEIEDYIWLTYENAYKNLKFENDKTILHDAREHLISKGLITSEEV